MIYPRKVYMIRHNITGRVYIGSTENVKRRWNDHLWALKRGNHPVGDFQDDFNKYGDNLSFTILDTIESHAERDKEYLWMQKYNSYDRCTGYNYQDRTNPNRGNGRKPDDMRDIKEAYILKIERFINRTNDIALLDLISKIIDKTSQSAT